ncbi:hypothetical protein AOC05_17785 [Arthrobacter alpinus]|uniref:Uncharacterized protein n=1 Tax=Arthrobacter alpinus TaxID=656366 RepID=A0A0M4RS17_9MICC|nr:MULTISPECIES: hypothetical protein [Arthrobacter]ALE93751.1 hypothetical protein AOC05_17785 [Arthrobacter alpinus]
MQTRHVGNNWVPLLCLSVLFLFSGAISMVTDRGNGSVPGVFVFGTLVTGGVSALWWRRNPSWWVSARNHYYYLAGGALAGVILSAMVPFLNGAGPWFVLGAAIATYGYFERLRLLVTVGGAVAFTGFLAMVIRADVWGGALHLISAGILAFAANKLYVLRNGRRREVQDSDPSFIGSFQEYDEDERVGF